jgi:CubicO group peptidase (beta-lactamase class C family)
MRKKLTMMLSLVVILALVLAACSPAPTPTPVPPTATVPSTENLATRLDTFLSKLAQAKILSGSVLVARKGEILIQNGYGQADREKGVPNTAQTKFRLSSITKQFTAMAILMLQARGKLNVQDAICTYLADCPATWQEITIHHLLTHTSGIPNYTDFPDFAKTKGTPSSPSEIIARFKDEPLDFRPGTQWRYSNSGYIVLGQIIEQVSGESYGAFLQKNIFQPLNMSSTGYDPKRDDLATGYANQTIIQADLIDMSILYAAGGLYSTVEDLYRWDQALYTDKLIPKELLNKMFTAYVEIPGGEGFSYGYGSFIGKQFERQLVSYSGYTPGSSANVDRYPDDRIVIIVLSNQADITAQNNASAISYQLAGMLFREGE